MLTIQEYQRFLSLKAQDESWNRLPTTELGHILGALTKLWEATISFIMSVHLSAWNNLAPTGWIFINLTFDYFLKIYAEDKFD